MDFKAVKYVVILAVILMTAAIMRESEAFARAGGGKSIGSMGSRSNSRSATPYSPSGPSQMQPTPSPYAPPSSQPQPAGGGFFRNMAGGILGGMLGGMLFRGLGFGGYGGGLFGIILILGIGYLLFRMVNRGREEPISSRGSYGMEGYQPSPAPPQQNYGQAFQPGNGDVATGLSHIRQMDAGFDENSFNDNVMDIFFNIQGAWMNRDLTAVSTLLTAEMYGLLQEDVKQLLREGRVNRLENIAVRSVEIVDAWQEQGEDFITARIYANLLDYTTDDTTGTVVAGSKTDPVKFEEFWTFTRPVGNNKWQLSAITQK